MSTKTTFKRIALVAVAALVLGVLSVAPSQAAPTTLTVTGTNGTATVLKSDSSTAASVVVSYFAAAATDSVTVTFVAKSKPKAASSVSAATFMLTDSTTSVAASPATFDTLTATSSIASGAGAALSRGVAASAAYQARIIPGAANTYISATFKFSLGETTTWGGTVDAGTYTYTAVVKNTSSSGAEVVTLQDVSIVVAASATVDTVASAVKSFAKLTTTSTTLADAVAAAADATVSGVSTAGSVAGYLYVGVRNADGTKYDVAEDSITATLTGAGNLCDGTTCGKSMKI